MKEVRLAKMGLDEIGMSDSVFGQIQVLDLADNSISTLNGIEAFPGLSVIYLQNNKIKDVSEFQKVPNKQKVKDIWVEGNPLCNELDYRLRLINIFPSLEYIDDFYIETELKQRFPIVCTKSSFLLLPFIMILNADTERLLSCFRMAQRVTTTFSLSRLDEIVEHEFCKSVDIGSLNNTEQRPSRNHGTYFETFKDIQKPSLGTYSRKYRLSADIIKQKCALLKRFSKRFR